MSSANVIIEVFLVEVTVFLWTIWADDLVHSLWERYRVRYAKLNLTAGHWRVVCGSRHTNERAVEGSTAGHMTLGLVSRDEHVRAYPASSLSVI
jgi:hypothetical protein